MKKGKKLYEGKAKIIYATNDKNLVIQYFKDDATAFNNQKKTTIEGKGVLNNRISEYILSNLSQIGIENHLVKRLNMREQIIKLVEIIPIEFIVRNIATGSITKRLGIAGHCMGGRVSFLGAASITEIKCNVVYYGGNMFKTWGNAKQTPFEKLESLRGPVIGFFGDEDENPSPEDVAKIEDRLTELDVQHEFHSYPGCGHAFQNFTNPQAYRAAATSDSFTKMIEWLSKNL